HLGGADEGTLPGEEVGGAVTLVQHGLHGVLHGVGLLQQAEGVPEHHGGREDGGHGVGLVLAGNVRGGAVDGLVHAKVALCQGGRGQHADGAGDLAGLVGEDVPEDVAGDDDVKLPGVAHQLHGGVVHVEVVQGDLGVVLGHL